MMDLLLKNVRINDDEELMNVAIKNGKIEKVSSSAIDEHATKTIDGEGHVLIPGLVESHIHLDKALISNRVHNQS